MRYYSIVLTGAPAAFPAIPGASQPGAQWDTWINGRNDPNAQRVEFSLIKIDESTNPQVSYLTIHGIPFAQIKQSADIVNCGITVYGGMKPGLPLATEQSKHSPNVLVEGFVQQAYGNWIGTDMSLTMIIGGSGASGGGSGGPGSGDGGNQDPKGVQTLPGLAQTATAAGMGGGGGVGSHAVLTAVGPRSISRRGFPVAPSALTSGIGGAGGLIDMLTTGMEQIGGEVLSLFQAGGSIAKPLNLVHNMRPNQLLSEAIRETLQRAFPKAKLDIAISPNLKLAYQDAGMYQSLVQYAGYIKQLSHSILGGGVGGYMGVHITHDGNTISAKDGTNGGQAESGPKQIAYIDLIGQPTWVAPATISIKTVLRGDIKLQDKIQLPPTLVTTQLGVGQQIVGGGDSQKLGALSFQGTFQVMEVLHTGDFRNPDGGAWCTTYQCITENSGQKDATKAATDTASANNVQTLPGLAQTATAAGMGGGGGVGSHAARFSGRSVRRY